MNSGFLSTEELHRSYRSFKHANPESIGNISNSEEMMKDRGSLNPLNETNAFLYASHQSADKENKPGNDLLLDQGKLQDLNISLFRSEGKQEASLPKSKSKSPVRSGSNPVLQEITSKAQNFQGKTKTNSRESQGRAFYTDDFVSLNKIVEHEINDSERSDVEVGSEIHRASSLILQDIHNDSMKGDEVNGYRGGRSANQDHRQIESPANIPIFNSFHSGSQGDAHASSEVEQIPYAIPESMERKLDKGQGIIRSDQMIEMSFTRLKSILHIM